VLELISLDYMVHKSNGNLYLGNILYLETETREEVIQKERLNFFFFFLISERLNLKYNPNLVKHFQSGLGISNGRTTLSKSKMFSMNNLELFKI
jgi:hypothetical protein